MNRILATARWSRDGLLRTGVFVALLQCALALCAGRDAAARAFDVRVFSPWSGYAIPNGVWLSGDFNGDGKTDVLHLVQNTSYAHVWTSKGDGTFNVGTFSPWPGYGIPNGQWLTGDFNGDGKTDVLHLVQKTNYAHVWTSKGDGTFSVGTFSPWPSYGIPNGQWLTGDFNGDGKTDVLHLVQNTNYAHVWTSKGDGTFNVGTFSPWPSYGIPNGEWLTGDFNGDGKTDVLHLVQSTNYAHVWMSKGNGTFNVGSFSPWPSYGIPNGEWHTGDFNGDGKTDVLHLVQKTNYAHVWTSKGDGTFNVGSFSPWASYGIPNGQWIVGDFNNDHRSDVLHLVQNTDYAHVWLSNGDGGFNVGTFSPWAGYGIPNGVWVSGDFNGDGKTDVLHAVNATSYTHPWLSTLPGPNQVGVDGLEVVQAVQDLGQTVPLVANKRTVVRAYLSWGGSGVITVRGTLQVSGPGGTSSVSSMNLVTIHAAQNFQITPKRGALAASLNFELPASATQAGTLTVRLTSLTQGGGSGLTCSDCASSGVTVQMRTTPPLRVRVVGLTYTSGTPATTYAPTNRDYANVQSWLRRAYPIGTLNYSQTTTAYNDADGDGQRDCNEANAQVAAIRSIDMGFGTIDNRTHYFGLVADGGGFMRGCASVPGSADPTAIGSGPTGAGDWGWDGDGSYGDWYTGHELGHTYGRQHPGSGCGESSDDSNYPFTVGQLTNADNRFVGLDLGDATNSFPMRVLPGTSWHDVMTYCNNQWLSSYTYAGIRDRLIAENGSSGAEPPAIAEAGTLPVARRPREVLSSIAARPLPMELAETLRPQLDKEPAPVIGARTSPKIIFARQDAPAPPVTGTAPALPRPALDAPPPPAQPAMAGPPPFEVRSLAEAKSPAAPALQKLDVQLKAGDYISVIGKLNLTQKSGRIAYVNRVPKALVLAEATEDFAVVRLRGADGNVLAEHKAHIKYDTDVPGNKDKTAIVDTVVPYRPGVASIELVLGGQVVDTRKVASRAPEVKNMLVPKTLRNDPFRVQWTTAHPDRVQVTNSVQVSYDGGKTWETVAVGLKTPQIDLDKTRIQDPREVRVRVIANDGLNNTVLESTP
jgi:hypothetical protein